MTVCPWNLHRDKASFAGVASDVALNMPISSCGPPIFGRLTSYSALLLPDFC